MNRQSSHVWADGRLDVVERSLGVFGPSYLMANNDVVSALLDCLAGRHRAILLGEIGHNPSCECRMGTQYLDVFGTADNPVDVRLSHDWCQSEDYIRKREVSTIDSGKLFWPICRHDSVNCRSSPIFSSICINHRFHHIETPACVHGD